MEFEFQGDWETKIYLKHFMPYYRTKYTGNGIIKELAELDTVYLRIVDKYGDLDPDPTLQQLETIKFLNKEENQLKTIWSIIAYLRDEVYPYYQDEIFSLEEYPESYPEIINLDAFYKHFKLEAIYILDKRNTIGKFYTLTYGLEILDNEHGMTLSMDGHSCINHGHGDGTMINLNESELREYEELRQQYHKLLDEERPIIYRPDPKYNKLKPWQVDTNRRFPLNAYRYKEDELIIETIMAGEYPVERFEYIYRQAIKDNRTNLISFFSEHPYFRKNK